MEDIIMRNMHECDCNTQYQAKSKKYNCYHNLFYSILHVCCFNIYYFVFKAEESSSDFLFWQKTKDYKFSMINKIEKKLKSLRLEE